jgi:formylmethanofuran dehydrogenase subunit A
MKISKNYNLSSVIKFTAKEKIKIAVVYDSWLKYYRIWPINWIKVGEWKIKNNVACGDDTVSFYAVNPREKNNLAKSLEAFSSRLPENVRQRLY